MPYKRRSRRVITAVVLAGAVTAVAAGCGSSGSSSQSANAAGGSGNSLSGTTITEWATPEGANQAATTEATYGPLTAEFKKETGITVNIQVIPWSDLLTKLTAAIAGGTGPDIAEVGDTWTGQLSSSDGFVPWTSSAFSQIGGESKFIPGLIPATQDPGQAPVDLMLFAESYALYYNKALFKQAGITSPPATWAEFVADAKKITDPSKGIYGVAADMSNISGMETWEWILSQQFGGRYFASPTKDTATVNTAGNVNAMQFLLSWIGQDHIMAPDNAQYNNNQAETQFADGKAGMIFTQTPTAFVGMPSSAWGVAQIPMVSTNPPAGDAVMSHLDGVNIGIFKSSTHLAADYAWLKFLTSAGPQTAMAKAYGVIPSTTAAAQNAAFQDNPNDKVWLQIQSKYAEAMPTQADSGTVQEAYATAIGQLADSVAESGSVSTSQVQSALNTVESTVTAREQG
jgi:multiple sugar transport system substrate-binding protein